MKKNLFFVFITFLAITCYVFAADWVQIAEKIYLDTSSLTQHKYDLNYDKDKLYQVWIKNLNDSTEEWKTLEELTGKKPWYKKSLLVVNCTKKEITEKSVVLYDLRENVIDYKTNSYLEWQSIPPETIGEDVYMKICRSTTTDIQNTHINKTNNLLQTSNGYKIRVRNH